MKQVFEIVPPAGPAFAVTLGGIMLLLAGLLALFAYMTWSAWQIRFEVSAEALTIRGGFYGRSIPRTDLVLSEMREADLRAESEYSLVWRNNGIGMPGYQAGWFKMQNGGKALAFLTDRSHVACVPTRQGYTVLMSVAKPAELLESLRR
jgi:hypothetical protein